MDQIKKYLEFLEYGRQLSNHTIKSIENDFKQFEGDLALATRSDVEHFVMKQNKRKMSTATVARRVASLRGFFEWQIFNGFRSGLNPAAGKIAPKIINKSHEAISYRELLSLYENAPTAILKTAIALTGFAGLRLGEVLGVGKHNQVYRDENGDLAIYLTKTKGNKERKVTLGLVPDQYLIEVAANRGGLIGTRGKLTENGLWRQMRKYFDEQGFKDFSPHGLRATFATLTVESGVRVDIVRDLLGHSTLAGNEMTSRYVKNSTVEEQCKEIKARWEEKYA